MLENGKWFLKDFCAFQYGDLKDVKFSRLHKNIINTLIKHGLWDKKNQCIRIDIDNDPHAVVENTVFSDQGLDQGLDKALCSATSGPDKGLDVQGVEEEEGEEKRGGGKKINRGEKIINRGEKLIKKREKNKVRPNPKARSPCSVQNQAQQLLEFYKNLTGKMKIKKIPGELTARLKEGHTVEDCKKVILYKFLRWWDDPKMKECVNLTTLFRPSHFEEYLSQAEQGLLQEYQKWKQRFIDDHMNDPPEERRKIKIPTFDEFCDLQFQGVTDGRPGS